MIDFGLGVSLRPLSAEDKDLAFDWRNDPNIYRWCRQSEPITRDHHEAWFKRQASDLSLRMYAICNETIVPVGVCGLTSIDLMNRRAEFSLYVGSGFQKRGYGDRALKTLFSHGFMGLGLQTIWGESFYGNPAVRIFEKIGLKKEGVRRDFYYRDGRFLDAYLYSFLRREWSCRIFDWAKTASPKQLGKDGGLDRLLACASKEGPEDCEI